MAPKQNHLSELRFALVAALAVLFGPFLSFVVAGYFNSRGGFDVQMSLVEFLEGLGGFLTLQFTIGLLFLIPTMIVAFVIGFPVWRYAVDVMMTRQIKPRLCILYASVGVTILTTVATDLLLVFAIGSGSQAHFFVTQFFAIGPLIVAIVCAQLLMVPTE